MLLLKRILFFVSILKVGTVSYLESNPQNGMDCCMSEWTQIATSFYKWCLNIIADSKPMSYPSFLQDWALINTDDEIWVEPEFYSEMRFDLVALYYVDFLI